MFRGSYHSDDLSLRVLVFDDDTGTSFELWNAWTDFHLRTVRVEPGAGVDEAGEIAQLMLYEHQTERVVVEVADNPDESGRQSYTSSTDNHRISLFGYPCDHIAGMQAKGRDVLVKGRVIVLPFGKVGYPDPTETPHGMLFPALRPSSSEAAPTTRGSEQ
jgi:hypothetical protein